MSRKIDTRPLLAALLGVVAVALLALPAGAHADPRLGVEITHSPVSIPRNDELMTYMVKARNEALANPQVGDTLTCNGVPAEWGGTKAWIGKPVERLSFTYQWLRNGEPIPGAGGSIPKGGPRPTYVPTDADAGRTIQCLIKGTVTGTEETSSGSGEFKSESALSVSQPPLTVEPPPSPEASLPPRIDSFATMSGTPQVGEQLQCGPPANWTGSPIWTFIWFVNGEDVGAGPTYTLRSEDSGGLVQCEAKGVTGSGEAPGGATVIALSSRRIVAGNPPGIEVGPGNEGIPSAIPQVEFLGSTSGEVRLELELPPGGVETRVFKINPIGEAGTVAWSSCRSTEPVGTQPARAICTTTNSAAPQQAFQPIEVQASLGPLTPDPAVVRATVSGGGSPPAAAQDAFSFGPATPFGIASFATKVSEVLGNDYTQAGGHPFSASATFELLRRRGGEGQVLQSEFLKDVLTDLPAGFVGNPQAVPGGKKCSGTQAVIQDSYADPACPRGSIVGFASVVVGVTKAGELNADFPIYEIEPERGAPAQFVFYLNNKHTLVSVTPRLRPSEDYAFRLETPPLPKNPAIFSVEATLCGFGTNVRAPVNQGHEVAPEAVGCKPPDQVGPEPANPEPFLTLTTQCSETPPVTKLAVDSWEKPGRRTADGAPDYSDPRWHTVDATSPKVTGCDAVPFEPSIDFQPTTHQADSPTGLDVSISVPTQGLQTPDGIMQGALKQAVVTLPKGMSVNPSAADGLGACTAAQISLGTNEPVRCPDSSKVGSVEVVTPLLELPLSGSVYLAKQGDNPFHSLLALYLVIDSKDRGILVKIPGHVEPRADGQLVANFDENPQVPFSSLKLHFNSGSRAPLMTPPACGSYGIASQLSPWSAPTQPLVVTSNFQITEGPGGGACPKGNLDPKLSSGLADPLAATASPFFIRLGRDDGTQRIDSLDLTLPPGLTAYLKGIPYCPDSILAGIPTAEGTGRQQIESPSCPSASQIGTATVGAGAGPNPLYVDTARVYLAGPYKGAPLSIAVVAPAVAGPFDLGNVVVRSGAYLNLETAQITVKSDPIPTVIHGIPLDLRDVRVNIDRPHFTLAPTNCEEMAIGATIGGETGGDATLSNRFQVGGCGRLKFKPQLKIHLKGATKRSGHPALKAVVTYPKRGTYANIARAQVGLPHAEFLDQGNLNRVCTQPELKSATCPAGSVYGHAKAWTPLLDKPLEGPVYIGVGYGHKLPDLVADLNGQVRVLLHGKVDTTKQHGIRNTFEVVPDAPVSRFVLEMKGGKKYGLLENSENICRKAQRASARLVAQNGLVAQLHPKVSNSCGKKHKKHHSAPHTQHSS